jgi:succinate-semialdehyde dehydrogenase/glutarate-semialdehyde dehydrogenase
VAAITCNQMYIDGAWTEGMGRASFPTFDPATGRQLAEIPVATSEDVTGAISAASHAFTSWSESTAYERSELLYTAHHLMLERTELLARLIAQEMGKPLRAARNEVRYAADFLLWYAEEIKRPYGELLPSPRRGQRFITLSQPVGVIGAITPWNYPVSMITRKIAPAVAAGCTVVLKPAEQTPLCAAAVFAVLHDAGLPPGVVNLVTTDRPASIAQHFLTTSSVRKITFTGSTQVGKLLLRGAADQVKRVSLELGGNAPFIVFEDANPEHAAKGAVLSKFLNAGQACICANRIYVHRSLLAPFVEAVVRRVKGLLVGNGLHDGVDVGPLVDSTAVDKMEAILEDALGRGARVIAGGSRLKGAAYDDGCFFEPTVLLDVSPEMRISREEIFGPLAPIIAFDSDDEVLALANDTAYGLAAYVYSHDLSRVFRAVERLEFAMVGVNDINPTAAAAPFGGVKESGLGREGGRQGLEEYLVTKVVGIVL